MSDNTTESEQVKDKPKAMRKAEKFVDKYCDGYTEELQDTIKLAYADGYKDAKAEANDNGNDTASGVRVNARVRWRQEQGEHRLYIGVKNVASITKNSRGKYIWSLWDEDGVGGQNSSEDTLYEAKVQAAGRAIIDLNELVAT